MRQHSLPDGLEDGRRRGPSKLGRLGTGNVGGGLDTWSFFSCAGGLIYTGSTLTNVNDLCLLLVL